MDWPRHHAEHHAFAPGQKIWKVEKAIPLHGADIAEGEEAAEAAIGGAVGRPGEDVGGAVAECQAAADGVGDTALFGGAEGANDAGERVAIGDADAGKTKARRRLHQFLGARSPAQKREVGGDAKLSEGNAGKGHVYAERGRKTGRVILLPPSCRL